MAQNSNSRSQRKKRWGLWVLGLLAVGALAGGAAYHYYPRYAKDRLVKNAGIALAAGDFRSAALLANRALQKDSKDATALRIMVNVAERMKDSTVITWKSRLVDVEPTLENRLSLAASAMDAGEPGIAKKALDPVAEEGKDSAWYHFLLGQAARDVREDVVAEKEFAAAADLEPSNHKYQYELAVKRIDSPKPEVRDQARAKLEELTKDPTWFAEATRALLHDAIAEQKIEKGLALAKALEEVPGAPMQDRILYLDLLHQTNPDAYATQLTVLEEAAAKSPEDVFALISWMNAHHAVMTAVNWGKTLPPELRAALPVRIGLAESFAMVKDWTSLEPIVTTPNEPKPGTQSITANPKSVESEWGGYEHRRLAYVAAILQAKGDAKHAATEWDLATKAAGKFPLAHLTLARYAVNFGWGDPTESLWQVARGSKEAIWALGSLYRGYQRIQSTKGMYRVMGRSLELNPSDLDAKNNYAIFALLLRTDVEKAVEIARQVHQERPSNGDYAATYAYGLFLQGKVTEAEEIMRALPAEQVEQPQIATYFAVILAAQNKWQEGSRYLQLARTAKLLPEEKELLDRAEAQIKFKSQPQPAAVGQAP